MSLQALYLSCLAHPAQVLNSLALFFAIAGSWLLLATRMRQQRALARLSAAGALEGIEADGELDEATTQLNRFFSRFGLAVLTGALCLSWYSTQL